MEFYAYQVPLCAFYGRFNSQRDGILRKLFKHLLRRGSVSIPNGMEFYLNSQDRNLDFSRFNFQRDGILPCASVWMPRDGEFQFPTGWNSTEKSWNEMSVSVFQFPTGWNSTKDPED